MTGLCRYGAYLAIEGLLQGAADAADTCDDQVTHTVCMQQLGDGLSIRVDVDVCRRHQIFLSYYAGCQWSVKQLALT